MITSDQHDPAISLNPNTSLPHLQMWLFLCLKFNNQRKFLMNSVLIQPHPARTNIHVQRPRLTHPKRLAETKHMTQDEWLEVRR